MPVFIVYSVLCAGLSEYFKIPFLGIFFGLLVAVALYAVIKAVVHEMFLSY